EAAASSPKMRIGWRLSEANKPVCPRTAKTRGRAGCGRGGAANDRARPRSVALGGMINVVETLAESPRDEQERAMIRCMVVTQVHGRLVSNPPHARDHFPFRRRQGSVSLFDPSHYFVPVLAALIGDMYALQLVVKKSVRDAAERHAVQRQRFARVFIHDGLCASIGGPKVQQPSE